ncbi:MAG TPA: hypothetical protein VGJ48_27070, partial [Pyrinomonadaceae bacterium]
SIDVFDLARPQSRFPLLFVFGRSDLTVPFYGAKVYPTDIEEIFNADANLVEQINSFQIASYEDEAINRRLKIRLEAVKELITAHCPLILKCSFSRTSPNPSTHPS